MIEFRTPKYICLRKASDPPLLRYQPRTLFVKVHRLQQQQSIDTSLTLSQTDAKMQSQQSEISNLSTFYQSCETKENVPIAPKTYNDAVLKKINSFHLNAKIRSNNKISRNKQIEIDAISPQTKRKQVAKREWEYSYRKGNSSFFQSVESSNMTLNKSRSSSVRLSTQSKHLKDMIEKVILNTKTFDEFLLSVVRN